jgi:DNA-binding transcriptional ArsR family regulator
MLSRLVEIRIASLIIGMYAANMSNHSHRYPVGDAVVESPDQDAECGALVRDGDAISRVRSRLSGDERIEGAAAIFSAMGDPTRVRILNALSIEELCVCDLAEISGISQSGVSHQLRLLRQLGLVAYRRDGNRAVYRLADDHVLTLLGQGLEHADEALEAQ